jgi:hypothetical protein
MATIPNAGPTANTANAHSHPTLATTSGMRRIEMVVIRKPIQVCSVSAVPR